MVWVAIGALVASAPGVQAEEGRALHVTDDTARHLRYTSRAKREADVSLSHRCTMEHPVAPWSTTMRRVFHPETNGVKASPHRHKWILSHGKRRKASSVTRRGRHRTSPALHVTRKTRSRRLAVAPLHHGAPRCEGCFTPRQTV